MTDLPPGTCGKLKISKKRRVKRNKQIVKTKGLLVIY